MWWILLTTAFADEPFGVQEHMRGHFAAATDVVWYVALGELDQVHEAAARLDHEPPEGLPEGTEAHVQAMREAARQLVAVPDLDKAAELTVPLGATCAGCHSSTGRGPTLTEEDQKLPSFEPGQMHSWAPYALWVGMVVPSDEVWGNGAAELRPPPERTATQAQASAFLDLARRARAAKGEERSAVWVDLLKSCRPCHTAGEVDLK